MVFNSTNVRAGNFLDPIGELILDVCHYSFHPFLAGKACLTADSLDHEQHDIIWGYLHAFEMEQGQLRHKRVKLNPL